MSNPAIVLMTDPSRCTLGDVHHLMQALLEMQQMGPLAAPQAFCDHPAAARDFLEAYTHAYPNLVLQDRAIPTPDHLQNLITSGQIGHFAQSSEPNPLADPTRTAEPNASSTFPVVVLALGNSQALLDALQQSPVMKENVRLIDIVPDGVVPMSIADAVALQGLEEEAWEQGEHDEVAHLDEIGGVSTTDPAGLALNEEPMSLDVVETVKTAVSEPPAYDQGGQENPGDAAPSAKPAEPESKVVEQPSDTLSPEEGHEAETPSELALESTVQEEVVWPTEEEDAELVAQPAEDLIEEPVEEPDSDEVQGGDDGDGPEEPDGQGAKGDGFDSDGDVLYPQVGTLVASADVMYPSLAESEAEGGGLGPLQELAAVLLDDGTFDPELALRLADLQQGPSGTAVAQDVILTRSASDNVIHLEGLHEVEHDGEDPFLDTALDRSSHDTDL